MRDYAEACDLSVLNHDDERPQVAARREHWHNVAAEKRVLLYLAIHYEEPRTRPCRGEECCA